MIKEVKILNKYNKKVEIIFDRETEAILDGQSKICNFLYNKLLEICKNDYKVYNSFSKITMGNNIRDMVPCLKYDFPFLNAVYSSPTKNVGRRLQDAYKDFYSKKKGRPKFRSWKKDWFSLFYDEPMKGYKICNSNKLTISLGKTTENKQLQVEGTLKEKLDLRIGESIKTFRLCKEKRKFFAVFTIEAPAKEKKAIESFISIDQNHKNFFVAIDNNGQTFEFLNLFADKYFDTIIDELKSQRDICNKKHKAKVTPMSGKTYYVPNKRYLKLDNAIKKAQARKQEQIKLTLYAIAHFIAKNYDKVIIGNYVPTKATAGSKYAYRSVLNQSHIGEFRKILKWVMEKAHKTFVLVDEKDTTKTCCVCGKKEKKGVDVREFTCEKCNTFILRDVNSAVNMAKKDGLLIENPHLSTIDRVGTFIFKQQRLIVI